MPNKVPRAYIDACYFIDVLRGRNSKLDADRVEHIPFVEGLLLAAQSGDIELWASTLIIPECLSIDKQDLNVPEQIKEDFKALLSSGHPVKLQAVDVFIAEKARSLRWDHKLSCGGGADMIHLATALELGCEEFITTNKKRGPLNANCTAALAKMGLRVITAPQTSLLPPQFYKPLLSKV